MDDVKHLPPGELGEVLDLVEDSFDDDPEDWKSHVVKIETAHKVDLDVPRCQICGRVMDNPKNPTTEAYGGTDCLRCMAEVGGDPGACKKMYTITGKEKYLDAAI